ncbi:MAG TPA: peptidylprolyl isomerase, partial [Alphaproteobacteria bacterium]|nr:peptidylprolyl isomerase [Alphaproteobacteria bacterium]
EYLISEIFLRVDKPSDEERVRELANNLVERIKQGTPFGVIAQQFSQGIGALNGGDLGWIQPGQLTGELDRAARQLSVAQISLPIRMADGFHILGKREERVISTTDPAATQVMLRQASLPIRNKPPQQSIADIKRFSKSQRSCQSLNDMKGFPNWSLTDLGSKKVSQLPEWLGKLVRNLPVNTPSPPMEKNGYVMVLYVCERNESGSNRDAIVNAIGLEKLELQAQRLLRDLRRSASIDIRSEG